ncbi:MAG: serine hydrolase domain-containing protein [Candidatus Eremiobacterota bacterium]
MKSVVIMWLLTALCFGRDDPRQAALDRAVRAGLPGVQVCVTGPDGRFAGVAGMADTVARRPVTEHTPFRIASCGKTMVAAVLLQLVAEGKLSLDDRLGRFVPDSVLDRLPESRKITVRMLLNHTSGLEDYLDDRFGQACEAAPTREWTHLEALKFAYDLTPVGRPGQKHYYSNTNYLLLGLILEKVAGQPLEATLRERLFQPLGMTRSTATGFARAPKDVAHGYVDGHDITAVNQGDGLADGAVISTASDMAIFLRSLLKGSLLPPAQRKEMQTWVEADGQGYGLGLARWTYQDGTVALGHDGGIEGYASSMGYYPESDLVCVVLTNTSTGSEVFNALLDELSQ